MRKLLSVVAGAGLLVTLSACAAPTPAGFAGCDTGSSAALVEVSGKGTQATATFPFPLVPESAENAVLIEGDGAAITSADAVNVTISVYDATTGEPRIAPTNLTSFVDGPFPFMSALTCAHEGGRVVATGTTGDLLAATVTGIEADELIVVVADVDSAFPARATGADQPAQAGFPSVVLAPNGQPGFTMLQSDPPTELKIAALKQGSGATVKEGDEILVNFSAIVWGASDIAQTTWTSGAPTPAIAADGATTQNGLPTGVAEAVIGQQVGSQLIVIAPPSYGYPAGTAPSGVTDTSTVVFVVDILKIG